MISQRTNKLILLIIAFSALFLFSCEKKESDRTILSVTIEPQRYFLEQIVGDKYEVKSLIPPGANPESFDPTPLQMLTLNNSKAYFKVGFLNIENNLIEKVGKENNIKIIDCSENIDIIGDNHEHHHHEGKEVDHEHGHSHDGSDPHYWNSVSSAKKMLQTMYQTMTSIDSINAEYYTINYNNALKKLDNEGIKIENLLKNSSAKSFIIYHPSLSYFARDYGLNQLSIEHEGKAPTPITLKNLIKQAKDENIKIVFMQTEIDTKNAEIIAKEIDAKIIPLDLLSYDWDKVMLQLATDIAKNG